MFGSTTREGDDGEFLIRGESDEFRTTDNTSLLGFEVVDLDEVVVRNVDGDDLVLDAAGGRNVVRSLEVLGVAITSEEIFNEGGKFLGPEFFIFIQENSVADVSTNLTSSSVTDVNTFILVKRNGLSTIEDADFNRRNVRDGSSEHPLVTSSTFDLAISEGG